MGSIPQSRRKPTWDVCAMAQTESVLLFETQVDKSATEVAPTSQPQESDWHLCLDAMLQAGGKCGMKCKVPHKTED